MFGVIGIPIRRELNLNNTEFGLLTSTPVLLGAIMRLPISHSLTRRRLRAALLRQQEVGVAEVARRVMRASR